MVTSYEPTTPREVLADLLYFQYSIWAALFEPHIFRGRTLELPTDFVAYLESDGVYLPEDNEVIPPRGPITDPDEDYQDWDDCEIPAIDNDEELNWRTRFPSLVQSISDAIQDLGGTVIPCLNWSCPSDAVWVTATQTLACTSADEVLLLLKSSDRVSHDLALASELSRLGKLQHTVTLTLRKWFALRPEREFRCFVRQHQLVGLCQRDTSQYFPQLQDEMDHFRRLLCSFHDQHVAARFPLPSYTYDVYITTAGRVRLVDFNPAGGTTQPLLYTWHELGLAKDKTQVQPQPGEGTQAEQQTPALGQGTGAEQQTSASREGIAEDQTQAAEGIPAEQQTPASGAQHAATSGSAAGIAAIDTNVNASSSTTSIATTAAITSVSASGAVAVADGFTVATQQRDLNSSMQHLPGSSDSGFGAQDAAMCQSSRPHDVHVERAPQQQQAYLGPSQEEAGMSDSSQAQVTGQLVTELPEQVRQLSHHTSSNNSSGRSSGSSWGGCHASCASGADSSNPEGPTTAPSPTRHPSPAAASNDTGVPLAATHFPTAAALSCTSSTVATASSIQAGAMQPALAAHPAVKTDWRSVPVRIVQQAGMIQPGHRMATGMPFDMLLLQDSMEDVFRRIQREGAA